MLGKSFRIFKHVDSGIAIHRRDAAGAVVALQPDGTQCTLFSAVSISLTAQSGMDVCPPRQYSYSPSLYLPSHHFRPPATEPVFGTKRPTPGTPLGKGA